MESLRFQQIAHTPIALKNWYIETFSTDFVMEFHAHPQIELMYCQHGAFDFIYKHDADALSTQSVTIRSNSLILVNTGYYHKIANMLPSTRLINLEFQPLDENVTPISESARQFMMPLDLLARSCPKLQKLLNKDSDFFIFADDKNIQSTMVEIISKANEQECDERHVFISLLTSKLFIDISHCISPQNYIKTGIIYVDSATAFINSHYMSKISIDDIASAAKVSKGYLQILFKKEFAKTIHEVVTDKRLMQAKYLLTQTNLSISEIALQCGFGCREHFCAVFNKLEKCSPIAYRKQPSTEEIRHFSDVGESKLSILEALK